MMLSLSENFTINFTIFFSLLSTSKAIIKLFFFLSGFRRPEFVNSVKHNKQHKCHPCTISNIKKEKKNYKIEMLFFFLLVFLKVREVMADLMDFMQPQ